MIKPSSYIIVLFTKN